MTARPKQFDVQVDPDHYEGARYESIQRFISYFYQIDLVRKCRPKTVLEIGIGSRVVADYLSNQAGLKVATCDFDRKLKPDVVGDIRDLPIKAKSFDVVLAAEILEHIPFEDVPQAVSELARVTKKNAVISVPYCSSTLEVILGFSTTYRGGKTIRLPFRMPLFLGGDVHRFNPEHYWELGRRGFSKRRFRKILLKHFSSVEEEFHPHLNPYHRFFLLKK